jgi:hypothetical protein
LITVVNTINKNVIFSFMFLEQDHFLRETLKLFLEVSFLFFQFLVFNFLNLQIHSRHPRSSSVKSLRNSLMSVIEVLNFTFSTLTSAFTSLTIVFKLRSTLSSFSEKSPTF